MLNIILDDDLQNRPTPKGFVRFTTGEDFARFLSENPHVLLNSVTFDNDLGQGIMEGYQALNKMLEFGFQPKSINLHTQNIVQQEGMAKTIQSAIRHGILNPDTNVTTHNLKVFTRIVESGGR